MTTSKIPAAVTELAGRLSDKIKIVDGKIAVDADAYITTLPEDISVEMVRKVHDHNSTFYPAATLAFGEEAVKLLKRDKKTEVVSAEFQLIDKDTFSTSMRRERTFAVPGSDAKSTTLGYVDASLVTQSSRANRGTLQHVRDHLTAQALAAFGEK